MGTILVFGWLNDVGLTNKAVDYIMMKGKQQQKRRLFSSHGAGV